MKWSKLYKNLGGKLYFYSDIEVTLYVMIDKQFLNSIFAGDNTAFTKLYRECRSLFMAFFNKHHPSTTISIPDLYQESIIQLWSNIVDVKITENGFTTERGLFSYIIGIGINKFREESRRLYKDDKLKKGEKGLKNRSIASREIGNGEEDKEKFPLQSKKQQEELEKMTRINETVYLLYNKKQVNPYQDSDESLDRLLEWSEFLREKYEELGYPCNQLLRDTWYNNMTDSEILEAFGGIFSNTNVVKTKRYKCHKALKNIFYAWKHSQN